MFVFIIFSSCNSAIICVNRLSNAGNFPHGKINITTDGTGVGSACVVVRSRWKVTGLFTASVHHRVTGTTSTRTATQTTAVHLRGNVSQQHTQRHREGGLMVMTAGVGVGGERPFHACSVIASENGNKHCAAIGCVHLRGWSEGRPGG